MDKLIGLDLDGVLLDHTATKIQLAAKYGIDLKLEQTPSDVMALAVPDDIRHQLQRELYDDPVISYQSPLMLGTPEALRALKDQAVPFVLITRRHNPAHTLELLKYHDLLPKHFALEHIHCVKSKEEKNTIAVKLGVTHYLDDEQGVLDVMHDVPNRFLFDVYGISPKAPYPRIASLAEFIEKI